jgi:uncharacterized protein with HEPN domain
VKRERKYIDFLQDVVDNLEKAERFVEGMDFEIFLEDEKTRYSVICALEIVGEAVRKSLLQLAEILRFHGRYG